jgi:uncharacterized protein (DUF433 family)
MKKKSKAGGRREAPAPVDEGWRRRVVSTPGVCHGQPCIRGTRVMVSVILDNLADGVLHDELLTSYPSISGDDIQAALLYAAELARGAVLTA